MPCHEHSRASTCHNLARQRENLWPFDASDCTFLKDFAAVLLKVQYPSRTREQQRNIVPTWLGTDGWLAGIAAAE